MKIVSNLELTIFQFFRVLLVLLVTLGLVAALLFAVINFFMSFESGTSSTATKPTISTTFSTPESDPIEEAAYQERLANARRSFASRAEDSCNQMELRSRDARRTKREIDSRYRERLDETEDINERRRVFESQREEYADSCQSTITGNSAEVRKLGEALADTAREFDVDAPDISTTWEPEVLACISNLDHCATYGNWTTEVAETLGNALAGDFGCSGPGTKFQLESDVDGVRQFIEDRLASTEDRNAVLDPLRQYTINLSTYYSGRLDGLSLRNQLTEKNAGLLADAMCKDWYAYANATFSEYSDYVAERDGFVAESGGIDWVGYVTRLAGLTTYLLAWLFAVVILAFFSMERSQTRIGKKKESDQ